MRSNYSHTFCEHRSVAALREIKSAFIPLPSPSFHVAQRKSGRRMLTLAYVAPSWPRDATSSLPIVAMERFP